MRIIERSRQSGNRLWHAGVIVCAALMEAVAQPLPMPPDPRKEAPEEPPRLTRMSITELMNLEVISVAKKEQTVSESPSAVYVLTQEDIRRSGANTVAEALRMVPGLQVARINANKYAISSRGYNGRFANKLLVLVDGRSVYSPLFSGVYWDVVDTFLLPDVDRVEIIRGPGATLWGANAVNGVINIITKSARDTQGTLVTGGGGLEESSFGGARYGGQAGENVYYRMYARFFDQDDFVDSMDRNAADEASGFRTGFRTDWTPNDMDLVVFQGDFYDGQSNDRLFLATPAFPFSMTRTEKARAQGGNLMARWNRTLSEDSSIHLQAYYDRIKRNSAILDAVHDIFDFDFVHHTGLGERQVISSGFGYRLVSDHIDGTFTSSYNPSERNDQLFSAFLQDEIDLVPDRLKLTLGAKVEHNDYTGVELQPSGRLLWLISDRQTAWASVARAVRTPARFEHDVTANVAVRTAFPVVSTFRGNSGFDSENLHAFEVGYRIQPAERWSVDLALFYNQYTDLRTSEIVSFTPGFPSTVVVTPGNHMDGETYGGELAAGWNVTDWWQLQAGYTFLRTQLHVGDGSRAALPESEEGNDPRNQFHIRSFLDLPGRWEFDTLVYYVDTLPTVNIPSYVRVDLRLGWRPRPGWEFSLVVQNLLDDRHPEFGTLSTPLVTATEVQRAVYGKVTWRF